MNTKEFYEKWRADNGITVEGYQLNYNQTVKLLNDLVEEREKYLHNSIMKS